MENAAQSLSAVRDDLSNVINGVETTLAQLEVEGIKEGRQALKECRMWFGVAEAKVRGLDPWANKVTEPAPVSTQPQESVTPPEVAQVTQEATPPAVVNPAPPVIEAVQPVAPVAAEPTV